MWKKLLYLSALLIALFAFSGCESADPDESQIPWGRPASWEGGPAGYGDSLPGKERY